MKSLIDIFKVLSDGQRLRIFMLLDRKELCVCQLMGIVGSSQPLVSRNLSLLSRAGLLDDRREGKLRFYRVKKNIAGEKRAVLRLLRGLLVYDPEFRKDLATLRECSEFQKATGRCDMKTLRAFMTKKKGRRGKK